MSGGQGGRPRLASTSVVVEGRSKGSSRMSGWLKERSGPKHLPRKGGPSTEGPSSPGTEEGLSHLLLDNGQFKHHHRWNNPTVP